MKYLTLMRHGDAEESDTMNDSRRPLTDIGRAEVSAIAGSLRTDGIRFDHVLSSSAARARQTTKLLASTLHLPNSKVTYHDDLYLARAEKILSVLEAMDGGVDNILVVGHNPGLFFCAELLQGEKEAPLPTAACIGLALHIDAWQELTPACASIRFRKYPDD
jgi:phosphohistidine phosphatase